MDVCLEEHRLSGFCRVCLSIHALFVSVFQMLHFFCLSVCLM